MMTLMQLLNKKGSQVWSVNTETTVYDALRLMAEKGIGALPVMSGGKLAGIVSERDYARKIILEGRSSRDTPVADIMSTTVMRLSPDHLVNDGMALMTEKRIRHLPVMEDGHMVGIVSIGDLVKAVIEDQEFVIGQLESYISGELA